MPKVLVSRALMKAWNCDWYIPIQLVVVLERMSHRISQLALLTSSPLSTNQATPYSDSFPQHKDPPVCIISGVSASPRTETVSRTPAPPSPSPTWSSPPLYWSIFPRTEDATLRFAFEHACIESILKFRLISLLTLQCNPRFRCAENCYSSL
jgi:hypothetical protein